MTAALRVRRARPVAARWRVACRARLPRVGSGAGGRGRPPRRSRAGCARRRRRRRRRVHRGARAARRRRRLSGLFLLALGLVGAPRSSTRRGTCGRRRGSGRRRADRRFVLAMALVLCARDPLTFLAGWELMSLAACGRDPRHAGRDRGRPAHGVRLHRGDASRAAPARGSRCCSSRTPVRSTTRRRSRRGSGLQVAVALAAIVGMGTKAGLMPLHTLAAAGASDRPGPRLGADERRDGQGRALRADPGARRVGRRPADLAGRARARASARSRRSAASSTRSSSAISSGCWRSAPSRTSGIIVARARRCLVLLRARGRRAGPRSRSPPRCCTRSTTRCSRRSCSSARARSSRRSGTLEPRPDRRAAAPDAAGPAGAFLVGCVAIAGRAAAERVRLRVADAAVAAARPGERSGLPTGSSAPSALAALAATAALALFCFVKVVGLVLLGPAATRRRGARGRRAVRDGAARWSSSPRGCLVLGVAPGLAASARCRGSSLGRGGPRRRAVGLASRHRRRCRRAASRSRSSRSPAVLLLVLRRRGGAAAARRPGPAGSWSSRELGWTSAGFTKPRAARAGDACCGPEREIDVVTRGGVVQSVS